MHAGIVNAGGYLVIRLSPLVVQAPAALGTLAIIGATTVCFAGVVMMTQSTVKRTLAYSTIAQMGFMMLQCGLGAFSAAMLHILAHSLYKAYAFLNSGSVVDEASGRARPKFFETHKLNQAEYAAGVVLAFAVVLLSSLFLQIDLASKPGGVVLGCILTLALASWLWDVLQLESLGASSVGLLVAALLAPCYLAGYLAVDHVVGANAAALEQGKMHVISSAIVVLAFCSLLSFRLMITTERGRAMLAPAHVHAAKRLLSRSMDATRHGHAQRVTGRLMARLCHGISNSRAPPAQR